MIVSATSITHVDQASKVTALALSGWSARVTETMFTGKDPSTDMRLEGSRAAFVDDTTLLLVSATGIVFKVDLLREGRLVRQLSLSSPLGMSSPPSVVLTNKSVVFIASTTDRSVLLKVASNDAKSSIGSEIRDGVNMETGM